jgi:ABC-type Fe3+/spermidine/putrescine transport system ATPase subunit
MTVAENIAYGLTIQKRGKQKRAGKVAEYIEMVGLGGFERRSIAELSGGEQQRVALARSLATEPTVLLLDEPLSNLDARLRDRMRAEIKALQQKLGITTIFVTHDQTEALTISDRIAVFDQGRCIQTGTPENIYAQPANSFVAGFIGDTNLFPAQIQDGIARLSSKVSIRLTTPATGNFISIRPQNIIFSETGGNGSNIFPARVENKQCTGVAHEYRVRVEDITLQLITLNAATSRPDIEVGAHVHIAIAGEGITILPR